MGSNKSDGTKFERQFAKLLSDHGFWVHLLTQNKAGQPADIIAAKGRYAVLIDCKAISEDKGFPFRRAEENQRHAMAKFMKCGGASCWFALRMPGGEIRMMNILTILRMEKDGEKALKKNEIDEKTVTFDMWLEHAAIMGDTLE